MPRIGYSEARPRWIPRDTPTVDPGRHAEPWIQGKRTRAVGVEEGAGIEGHVDGRGRTVRSPARDARSARGPKLLTSRRIRPQWSIVPLRPVSLDDIESIAIGAWILGTGGGGSPYLALLNLRKLYAAGKVVSLMDPADLADDDRVAVVSNMGAPLVGQERLTDPDTMARAVTMMEEITGQRFRAIMSLEIGGGNALQPFLAAALLDRPVVDADCMGRAFPEAQMTSFAIHDLRMYPLTLVDVRNNAVVVARAESWKWMERLSRTACVAVGSIASTCKAPRTGKEVKECGILHSTTKALRIGRTVREARRAHRDPIAAVVDVGGGLVIFRGKVSDVNRRATEGFLRGHRDAGRTRERSRPCPSRSRSRTSSRSAGSTGSLAS